jgi:hypothetical protein
VTLADVARKLGITVAELWNRWLLPALMTTPMPSATFPEVEVKD